VPRPGESADDVDIEFAPEGVLLGNVALPEGTLLFINGDSGVADIYAIDTSTGLVLATLNTAFGASHVVGGGYHRTRDTLFLIQDEVPGAVNGNRVAEVDPVTGTVLNSFQTNGQGFSVFYGDLDILENGNFVLVSSSQSSTVEFTPAGGFVQSLSLPAGVTSLSGVAFRNLGQGWVCGTGGLVWQIGGLPTCGSASYCTAGTTTNGCNATITGSRAASATAGSGFTLSVANVEGNKSGLIFYGLSGPIASPWGTGTSFLCVKAPTQRTGTLSSGGTSGACDGVLSIDWNQYIASNPTALGVPFAGGETVQAQAWFRDPPAPKTTNLSDALQFTVCS
jgi:hypothetical protein